VRTQLVTKREDGWLVLPLEGMRAEELLEELWLVLRVVDDEARIGIPDELVEPTTSVVADQAVIVEALVSPDGRLEATFANDYVLSVAPLEDVEAWEVRGPGKVTVVCLPGGGEPAVWDSSTSTYTARAGEPSPPEFTAKLVYWFEPSEGEDE